MTKTSLIRDLRSQGYTKTGAKKAAETFISSMRFAGLLFEIGDEFFLHPEGRKMQRKYEAMKVLAEK